MKKKETIANDCSFPLIAGNYIIDGGLTKREYFAALAMQGFLSCNAHDSIEDDVKYSVKCEDALIEELNKTKDK